MLHLTVPVIPVLRFLWEHIANGLLVIADASLVGLLSGVIMWLWVRFPRRKRTVTTYVGAIAHWLKSENPWQDVLIPPASTWWKIFKMAAPLRQLMFRLQKD